MADPGGRRHDAEVVERLLAPAQERVALAVALVVALGVDVEGARAAEGVDLDRVVDHEVDRDQRVDPRRVAAELVHRVAHRRQVDDRRHAGEVLHQDPGRLEGDLLRSGSAVGVPGGDRLDVGGGHRVAVLEPQRVLEQDLERVGQPGDVEASPGARRAGRSRTRGRRPSRVALGAEGIAHRSSIRRHRPAAARPLSACRSGRGDLVRDLGRASAPASRADELGRVEGDPRERALAQRRDGDLAAIALDRADHRGADLLGRRRCRSAAAPRRPSRRTSRPRGSRPG